ncbi:Uncharacterized protein FKW44_021878, partial [Caligus rogercresseyi]
NAFMSKSGCEKESAGEGIMFHLTRDLFAPKSSGEFTNEWARKVLVAYFTRTDKDWLLADVLKVVDLVVTDNPNPGS